MWSKDLCIPRSIASRKKVGCRHVGMCTKPDGKQSFTSSRVRDANNSRQKKQAGIASCSQSLKCDKPPKSRPQKAHKQNNRLEADEACKARKAHEAFEVEILR